MLRYNIDTGKGLVNGAIGHVTEIIGLSFVEHRCIQKIFLR